MDNLQQRFIAHWKARNFAKSGDTVLLALSGGIDSMALAHLLLAADISFAVAHCNFSLRGKDSDDDEAFVADWCRAHQIVFHTTRFDTAEIARQTGKSIQLAARDLRYEWFEKIRSEHSYVAILTAHHSDDIAETMLINLCRGTGIAGLHGIPERNGKIIRPLLFASRKDIVAYASSENIAWREDASNAHTNYLRNSIRLGILPELERLFPGVSSRIAGTADILSDTEIIYREALQRKLDKLVMQRGTDSYIPIRLLQKQKPLNLLVYELLTPYGFSPEQIPQVLRLLDSESGKGIASETHRIIRHRDFLVLTNKKAVKSGLIEIASVPASVSTAIGDFYFSYEPRPAAFPQDERVGYFSVKEMRFPLFLRTRKEGDYFYPLGMGMKKKKIKKLLNDLKIPIHLKERILVLESDKRIAWIAGRRMDERFRVGERDEQVLKIVYEPKDFEAR